MLFIIAEPAIMLLSARVCEIATCFTNGFNLALFVMELHAREGAEKLSIIISSTLRTCSLASHPVQARPRGWCILNLGHGLWMHLESQLRQIEG